MLGCVLCYCRCCAPGVLCSSRLALCCTWGIFCKRFFKRSLAQAWYRPLWSPSTGPTLDLKKASKPTGSNSHTHTHTHAHTHACTHTHIHIYFQKYKNSSRLWHTLRCPLHTHTHKWQTDLFSCFCPHGNQFTAKQLVVSRIVRCNQPNASFSAQGKQ